MAAILSACECQVMPSTAAEASGIAVAQAAASAALPICADQPALAAVAQRACSWDAIADAVVDAATGRLDAVPSVEDLG